MPPLSSFAKAPVTGQAGTLPPLSSFAKGGSPASTPAPQQSFGDQIWNSLVSVAKAPLNPMSYAPAVKAGLQNIANAPADIANAAQGGIQQIQQGASQINQGGGPLGGAVAGLEGGLKVGSGIASVVSSPLAPVMKPVGAAIDVVANKVSDIPAVQKFANSSAGQTTARVAGDVANAGNIAGTILGVDQVAKETPAVVDSLKNINYPGKATITGAPISLNEAKVSDLYNRAIRPTVSGQSTGIQAAQASSKVLSGLKTIADNKPNLSFTGADGETTTGATPKSVDQLSQAITQTKTSIFKQYDSLAKQAGESGVVVEAPKIASELQPVIDSKSLAIANPDAVNYAKSIQDRLNAAGGIDAQTAQDVIQHYNDALKSFYKNPSYDTASKASIDALVANKFREQLDAGISNLTGEQYQSLKNQYGALSSMEKDVTHRNIVWGRQNNVSLAANISNIASGAELVRGLISMNPADLAVSGTIQLVKKYAQYLNNPDVGVSKIFSEYNKVGPGLPSTGNKSVSVTTNTVK